MKKYLIFLFLILFFHSVKSQSFYAGINLGATISQVDGDNFGGYRKIAPSGGIYVRNTFNNPQWGTSIGILYKNKGSRDVKRDEDDNIISDYAIKLNYIEIPLMFNYNIKKISIPGIIDYNLKRDLYLEFGISYGYLVKGGEYFEDIENPTKTFKKHEIATHIGLLYRFSEHFLLNYRFSYTFAYTPVYPHPGGQVRLLNRGLYNNNMSLSLVYEF